MKKRLAAAITTALVVGVASTTFAAANPFVDVPAKHWAYDAVTKLAQAGIVDGYGDGTFRGDKTITRYEMAQIVAKAMTKSDKADATQKAALDKLAVEFSAELNNLGVRVAKLEAKQSNIKMTGESRIRYSSSDNDNPGVAGTNGFDWRQRFYLSSDVNEKVSYGARLEATGLFGGNATSTATASAGEVNSTNNSLKFNRAFFAVKDLVGFDKVTVGRFGSYGLTYGLLNGKTSNNDGVIAEKKIGSVTFKGMFADEGLNSEVALYSLYFNPSKVTELNASYLSTNMSGATAYDTDSYDFGVKTKVGKLTLTGEYVTTDKYAALTDDAKAWAVQLTTGNGAIFYPAVNIVNPAKANTQAFAVSYRNIEAGALPGGLSQFTASANGAYNSSAALTGVTDANNVKGFFYTYQNVLAKNTVLSIEYQDLEKESTGQKFDKTVNAHVQFFF